MRGEVARQAPAPAHVLFAARLVGAAMRTPTRGELRLFRDDRTREPPASTARRASVGRRARRRRRAAPPGVPMARVAWVIVAVTLGLALLIDLADVLT